MISWFSFIFFFFGYRVFIFEEECIILIVRNVLLLYGVGIKWFEINVLWICLMVIEVLIDKDDYDMGI